MPGARILVVDDEQIVLDLVDRALKARGYEVIRASDPFQGLKLAATPPPVDLILSDVVMPGMRGPELVRRVKEATPGAAALLMSGFAAGPDMPADIPFVSKPFKITDLVSKIEELLRFSAKLGEQVDSHRAEVARLSARGPELREAVEESCRSRDARTAVKRSTAGGSSA